MASLIAYPLGLLDRVKKTRAHLNPTSLPMDQEYNKLLDEGRRRGDDLADAVLQELNYYHPSSPDFWQKLHSKADEDPHSACKKFVDYNNRVPEATDFDKMNLIREFWLTNGHIVVTAINTALIESYCMSEGAHVLTITGRLVKPEEATKRVLETGLWLNYATTAPRPNQKGWEFTIKVRLVHAWVRRMCVKTNWDYEKYGHPVNQTDSIGTLFMFSWVPLRNTELLGVNISQAVKNSSLHLFSYIGYLLGVEDIFLPKTWKQHELYYNTMVGRYNPNQDSILLTKMALDCVRNGLFWEPKYFAESRARFFVGDYFADRLGLAKGSIFADLFLAASICKTQVDQICQKYVPGYSTLTWTVNLVAWKLLNIVVKSAEFDSKKKKDLRNMNSVQ
jgi:hypothetical protein